MAVQAQLYSENFGIALGISQDLVMENAGGLDNLCFINPQQQQRQQQMTQFDFSQNLCHQKNHNFLVDSNMNQQQSMGFPQSISAYIDRQRIEFEQFLNLQTERLRLAMEEQRKQQISLLLKKYESKTQFLLKQKEEQILKAANRTTELQYFLNRIQIENQTWQKAAKENEDMIASLNSTIQQLRESTCLSSNVADDAESCCQIGEERKMVCKCCNRRECCVVILPCRHLCCCKECEVYLDSCPVCRMIKKGSIEALI